MTALGSFALYAALVVTLYGLAAGILGLRRRDPVLLESSRRAVAGWAGCIALAAAALLYALVTRDFSIRFVAETTRADLPLLYTVTAFWGGHAGSLLLWALVLALYGAIAASSGLRRLPSAPIVFLVLLGTAAFFTLILAASGNPFEALRIPPPDGRGLNPLLRNPWMAAHPPALYLGFVGTTVPFALAVAALASGDPDGATLRAARPWVRLGWLFLTVGLLFGAKWSYVVLGWGGYWAWDPVENAALMPWLTGAAYLHSVQVFERDGTLRRWTAGLLMLSFALAILGTFLTRSGVLSSVHAFANSSVGLYFVVFLALSVAGSAALLLRRRRDAGAADAGGTDAGRGGQIDSLLSREAAFLANNVLLVTAAGAVLLGTLFPILAEAVTGDRINVGPPYFNQVLLPVVVLLLLLMAVGPLLSWRRSDPREMGVLLAAPGALGALAALGGAALGIRHPAALLIGALCVFTAAATVVEAGRGAEVRRRRGDALPVALVRVAARARTRYGGYLVHLGLLIMLAGITGSSVFTTQTQTALRPGERVRLGRYEVRYDEVSAFEGAGLTVTAAALTAFDGRGAVSLEARHVHHRAQDAIMAEVAIHSTWRDDLYVVLIGLSGDRRATFRILVNPMVAWLWAGAALMVAGGTIAALPARRRVSPGVLEDARQIAQPELVR